jgi:hypothetical protein
MQYSAPSTSISVKGGTMRGKLSLLKDERITLLVKVQPTNQPPLYQLILGKDFHFFFTSLWKE